MRPELNWYYSFAKMAHKGQVDKGGEPYFNHVVAVVEILGEDATYTEKAAAYLHDVVEDTDYTIYDFYKTTVPKEVIEVVKLLTRDPKLSYQVYINDIVRSHNKAAIKVKIADLTHNLDTNRKYTIPKELRNKYEFSLNLLRMNM